MHLIENNFRRILLALLILLAAPAFAQDWEAVEEEFDEIESVTQQQLKEETRRQYEQQPVQGTGIDREVWKEVTRDADYTENVPKPQKQEKRRTTRRENTEPAFTINTHFARVVLIIIILGVLTYLILRLFGVDVNFFRRRKKFTNSIDIERLEDELPKSELERYLDQALAEENYRLALRILYLMVIKALWEARLIRWKREKTNRDYLREMRQSSGYGTFSRLTYLFERVWYGDRSVSREDYNRLSPVFQSYLGKLKEGGK